MSTGGKEKINNTLLGFGERGRLAQGAGLLAEMLEDSQVFRIDGRHDCNTWKKVWSDISLSPAWEQLGHSNNDVTLIH